MRAQNTGLKRYEDAMKMDPTWMKNCKPEHRKMFLDNSVMRRDLLVEKLDAVIDYKKTIDPRYQSSHIMDAFRPRIGVPYMTSPCPVNL